MKLKKIEFGIIVILFLVASALFAANDGGPGEHKDHDSKHEIEWLEPLADAASIAWEASSYNEYDNRLLYLAVGNPSDASWRKNRDYVMSCVYSGGRPRSVRGPGGYMLNAFVRLDDHEVVECLLEHSANPNAAVKGVDVPALFNVKSSGMVRTLLKAGADPHAENVMGHTALRMAVLFRKPWPVLAALCQAGIPADDADGLGFTPLHKVFSVGCTHDDIHRALVLLACGADENRKNGIDGKTVQDRLNAIESYVPDEALMDHMMDFSTPPIADARTRIAQVLARRQEIVLRYEKQIWVKLAKSKDLSTLVMDYFGIPIVPLKDIGLEDKDTGWRADMAVGARRTWHRIKKKIGLYDIPND